ncbi:MAG TPA: hypothetical protein VFE93_16885 [Myxococcaceae bacterium]|nr:hypothetical protein [Myxococcaceae bacterium]
MPVRVASLALVLLAADVAPEPARVAAARARTGPGVIRALEAAGVPRPRALLLRVFKEERVLEIWVAGALRRRAAEPDAGPVGHVSRLS